jgi:hypothetical protein
MKYWRGGGAIKLYYVELHKFYSLPDIIRKTKSRRRCVHNVIFGYLEEN